MPDDFVLEQCVRQYSSVLHGTGIAHLTFPDSKQMTMRDFKRHAVQIDQPALSLRARERRLWQELLNGRQGLGEGSKVPIYAIDNEMTRFPANWPNWN